MTRSVLFFVVVVCGSLLPSGCRGEWFARKSVNGGSGKGENNNNNTVIKEGAPKWGIARHSEGVREALASKLHQTQVESPASSTPEDRPPSVDNTTAVQEQEEFTAHEKRVMDVFEQVSPSVVFIQAFFLKEKRFFWEDDSFRVQQGTGILWDDQHHIVTNHHVVCEDKQHRPSRYIRVIFRGGSNSSSTAIEAAIVQSDPTADVAVLQLLDVSDLENPLPDPIRFDLDSKIRQGQSIVMIGFWQGVQIVSTGVVSNMDIKEEQSNEKDSVVVSSVTQSPVELVFFDAGAERGVSGGPLVDSSGRLVGIVMGAMEDSRGALNLAIQRSTVVPVVQTILEQKLVVEKKLLS